MTLREWLAEHHCAQKDFAARIERSEATVSRLANGTNRPDAETARRIYRATNGAVTPNDFLGLDDVA